MTSVLSEFHEHASREAMAKMLASHISDLLSAAIQDHGSASLAVSGGSTPKALYEQLSLSPLDWSKVTIVLVDERWVEPKEPGSNESFIDQTLMQNAAAKARFIGLKTNGETPQDGLEEAKTRLSGLSLPFDVVILGMGPDGHTASWFPHAHGLDNALDGTGLLSAIEAKQSDVTGPHTHRITLSRKAIMDARAMVLMISGSEKRQVWDTACQAGDRSDMPVRALLHDDKLAIETHWAA